MLDFISALLRFHVLSTLSPISTGSTSYNNLLASASSGVDVSSVAVPTEI